MSEISHTQKICYPLSVITLTRDASASKNHFEILYLAKNYGIFVCVWVGGHSNSLIVWNLKHDPPLSYCMSKRQKFGHR